MNIRWEIKNNKEISNEKDLLEILLANRGVVADKDKKEFLDPPHPKTYRPEKLGINKKAIKKAQDRIQKAIEDKQQIVVYGDYDADGICATAIMWEALDDLGAKATPYIPNRFEDGYGINPKTVKKLKDKYQDLSLIITVDNGIVAFDAIEEANKLGVNVIITDHHEKKETLPDAYSVIHTTATSGSGVAYLFSQVLVNKDNESDNSHELAAIGTMADQLPLVGFNRSLAKHGLQSLRNTRRIGLRKLFAICGILEKPIGAYEVNFVIAPRINASGRMSEGIEALRLLCTRNMGRAETLAKNLNTLNLDRQITVEEALKLANKSFEGEVPSVIVLSHEEYHEGVIGLIASRLTEKFYRPTIVLSSKGEVAKASARSISGFNIIEAIRFHEDLILEGGGHEMAAGFSIDIKNIKLFTKKINEYAEPLLLDEVLERKVPIDSWLKFSLINQKVYNTVSSLEPHGSGNPAPVFATKSVKVVSQKHVGKENNHLKLVLESEDKKVNAMMFNYEDKIESDYIDIAYKLSENTWNGNTTIEIMLKDIRENK